jgi:hypothetical protein
MVVLGPTLFNAITGRDVLLWCLLFIASFVISLAAVSLVLIRLPTNYFQSSHSRDFLPNHQRGIRVLGTLAKNLLGVLLVLFGAVMSVPGVPGQGLLTILLGVMLLDFPGKRRLEQKLVSQPRVFNAINRLRQRFGKPSLMLD